MVYSSDVISDLALLFPTIDEIVKNYADYGLKVNYRIIVDIEGYIVIFEPYGI